MRHLYTKEIHPGKLGEKAAEGCVLSLQMKSHDRGGTRGRGEPSQPASSLCLLRLALTCFQKWPSFLLTHSSLLSFKETCSLSKKKEDQKGGVIKERIQEEYEKLGAIT